MSGLWTPGSNDPQPEPSGAAAYPGQPSDFDVEAMSPDEREALVGQMQELHQQLVQLPASTIVANHAYGLFELAAVHLGQRPPSLEEAAVAIDALAGVVEALAGRLGPDEEQLGAALAQIRLAFVQLKAARDAGANDAESL